MRRARLPVERAGGPRATRTAAASPVAATPPLHLRHTGALPKPSGPGVPSQSFTIARLMTGEDQSRPRRPAWRSVLTALLLMVFLMALLAGLLDHRGPLVEQGLGGVGVGAFGPQVGDRLGRVGQHQDPARSGSTTRTPSVVSTSGYRPPRPRCASRCPWPPTGSGIDRRSRCASGIRASIWLSVSRVRATRPSSRANAAMPSTVRANSGTTNPPRPSAAKITSSAAAAWVSASIDGRGPVDLDPVEPADLLGHPGGGDRQRHPAALRSAATRSSTTSRARSSLTRSPFSSTSGSARRPGRIAPRTPPARRRPARPGGCSPARRWASGLGRVTPRPAGC